MRSTMTAYPEVSPWISLSTRTASAVMPSTFRAFTRSINAQGNVSSWPNRIPTFFMCFPPDSGPDCGLGREDTTGGGGGRRHMVRSARRKTMRTYTAVIERCPDTGLYVGYVPGFPGAHSQAESLDELNVNLHEVVEMLLEDGEPPLETEFIGIQTVLVA